MNFLLGFLSGCALCGALAIVYYIRAIRRVRSIQAAIQHYQQAQAVVGEATRKIYGAS